MSSRLGLAWLLVTAAPALAAQAGDLAAGRQKAIACAVCHGAQGLAVALDAPHLAGQPALYIAAQLRAYRSGARRHEVMSLMAKPLTDTDIDDLSAWFASQKLAVQGTP